jgi:glycosyltransferase involved in cell wall biosynthesis
MACEISVITCSFNPRSDYLEQVIEGLKEQTLNKQHWEYLLVDNASDQPLRSAIDLTWHPHAKHVREDQLGLTHARLRGISEAEGDILVFVDDDNVLDADFLEQTLNIAKEWSSLGAWSGQTRPSFEIQPPEWTKRYWGNLVIRTIERDSWSNLPHLPHTMPCGAGLCVRRDVAAHYFDLHANGKRSFVLDRVGDSLVSAGDNDLAACACDINLGVGLFVSLKLTHLIPKDRLQEDYLVSLVEGISFSSVMFKSFRSQVFVNERVSTKFANVLRMALMNKRERRFFRATKKGERRAYQQLRSNGHQT